MCSERIEMGAFRWRRAEHLIAPILNCHRRDGRWLEPGPHSCGPRNCPCSSLLSVTKEHQHVEPHSPAFAYAFVVTSEIASAKRGRLRTGRVVHRPQCLLAQHAAPRTAPPT